MAGKITHTGLAEGIEFILDSMNAPIKPDLQKHIDGLNTTLSAK